MKTDKILFSKGGIDNSTGVRGGQISHKICGMYEPLILNNHNINSINKIIIAIKLDYNQIELFHHLKRNNNKILLDVVDLTDKNKYNPELNKQNITPNFLPDIPIECFDGYIVNNSKQKEWWRKNVDPNSEKPIFVIPHHWDSRFEWFPKGFYQSNPYFYYLGTDSSEGYKNQNCLHLEKLLSEELINDWRSGSFPQQVQNYDFIKKKPIFYDKPQNGVQISIRKTNSWEYCMKPATKLAAAAAMGSLLITTNDWSIQDLLPQDYPYILKDSNYNSVTKMIEKVKNTFNKEEGDKAREIMSQVKKDLSIDTIIKEYYKIINYFS
jgi:hypothetical protein